MPRYAGLGSLTVTLLVAGCTIRPTASQIADCRSSALAEARPAQRARSVFIDVPFRVPGMCLSCRDLLRRWRLDFVEFRSPGSDRLVDRVRLLPHGDPACAPTSGRDRQPERRLPLYLSVPKNSCLAIEPERTPEAEARLSVTGGNAGDHSMELYEGGPRIGGAPVARVRDFTIRAVDAAPATCAKVLAGFPADPLRYVMDRVAARR
jgi:hypothetical protein